MILYSLNKFISLFIDNFLCLPIAQLLMQYITSTVLVIRWYKKTQQTTLYCVLCILTACGVWMIAVHSNCKMSSKYIHLDWDCSHDDMCFLYGYIMPGIADSTSEDICFFIIPNEIEYYYCWKCTRNASVYKNILHNTRHISQFVQGPLTENVHVALWESDTSQKM